MCVRVLPPFPPLDPLLRSNHHISVLCFSFPFPLPVCVLSGLSPCVFQPPAAQACTPAGPAVPLSAPARATPAGETALAHPRRRGPHCLGPSTPRGRNPPPTPPRPPATASKPRHVQARSRVVRAVLVSSALASSVAPAAPIEQSAAARRRGGRAGWRRSWGGGRARAVVGVDGARHGHGRSGGSGAGAHARGEGGRRGVRPWPCGAATRALSPHAGRGGPKAQGGEEAEAEGGPDWVGWGEVRDAGCGGALRSGMVG